MNQKVEQFHNQLNEGLEALRQRVDEVKAIIEGSANETRDSVGQKQQAITARFQADRQKLVDARALAEQWLDDRAAEAGEKIAAWEYQLEVENVLEKRAEKAESKAASAILLAAAAIEDAEDAILEAYGARLLAEDAKCGDEEFIIRTGTY